MPGWAAGQLPEVAAIGVLPVHRAVAQHLRRHFRKPRRQLGLELAVLLVDGRLLPGQRQGLAGEGAEIAVFVHLGVIDEALAADPAQEDSFLRRRGVTAEALAAHAHNSPC